MSSLKDLLSAQTVRVGVQASSWQEAIQQAGNLLAQTGAAGDSYTQKMIDSVVEHGPYIVIAPGFAFAHARPDTSVQRTAMSLIKLAEPVSFGHPKNDPVTLVLALSAEDAAAHQRALAQLAGILADQEKRSRLDAAQSEAELLSVFDSEEAEKSTVRSAEKNTNLILTVCGNGLGTSLFLKNTLEQVLDYWGWGPYLRVEATDTISARGRASEADFIMTSGEIAKTLGEVDVPVKVIEDFTSQKEIDTALRDIYDV